MRSLWIIIAAFAFLASCGQQSEPTGFGRFRIQVHAPADAIAKKGAPLRSDLVNGTVEVSQHSGSVCLTLTGLTFSEASLEVAGSEAIGPFALADSEGGDICLRDLPSRQLSRILNDWRSARLIVELAEDGTVLESSLESFGEQRS